MVAGLALRHTRAGLMRRVAAYEPGLAPGLDLASGTLTVPLWAVGVAAALAGRADRHRRDARGLERVRLAGFRVAVDRHRGCIRLDLHQSQPAERDRADERRALDQRAAELASARAIAPGSAIACLEATNTKPWKAPASAPCSPARRPSRRRRPMCRRGSRCSPTRMTTRPARPSYEASIAGLRRTIAADRYGLASQVLGDARRLHRRCVRRVQSV